jgi:8-oxo-dGTP diphosphatase
MLRGKEDRMSGTPYRLSLKAVVRDERGRVLLLRRSARCKANAGKWELPGGKLDPGETIDEALRREIAEETGLAVHIERVAGAGESARPDMRVAYLFMEARAEAGPVVLSDERGASPTLPLPVIASGGATQGSPEARQSRRPSPTALPRVTLPLCHSERSEESLGTAHLAP